MVKEWIDAGVIFSFRAKAKMGAQVDQLSVMIDELLKSGPTVGTQNTTVETILDGIHFSIEYSEGIDTVKIDVEGSLFCYDHSSKKLWPLFFHLREGDMAYTYNIQMGSEEVITIYRDEEKLAEYCFRSFY